MTALTPLQRAFLSRFFARENARAFYLTGGGALAEFYLGHRVSQDIDLFTQDQSAWSSVEADLSVAAEECEVAIEFRPAKPGSELHRAMLSFGGEAGLKVDIVRDAPPHLGQVRVEPDGIIVDSLENIAAGKLLALYGRAYPRDFFDLHFLLTNGQDFQQLMAFGKEKDPGLEKGPLAAMMRLISRLKPEDFPIPHRPFDFEQMRSYFYN